MDGKYISRATFMWTIGVITTAAVLVLTQYVMPAIEKMHEDRTQRLLLAQKTEMQMDNLKDTIAKVEALAIGAASKAEAFVNANRKPES